MDVNRIKSFSGFLTEQLNIKKKSERLVTESFSGYNSIVNVDIQPEYEQWISFNIGEWAEWLNRENQKTSLVFLYNGWETLGMIKEIEYKQWLFDKGVSELVLNSAVFYDKGYNFFRYCIDSGIDEDDIVLLIKFMIKYRINDSRDINEENWDAFTTENKSQAEIRDLLEFADDMIYIPDLMDFLNPFNDPLVTGGGVRECLKEVEIALLALEKKFNIYNKFTY